MSRDDIVLAVTYLILGLGRARDPWGTGHQAFETEIRLNDQDFCLTMRAVRR